jgi:hypothetical protein
MATISLSRRPIRDEAERKNEFTCRISPIPSAPGWNQRSADSACKENGRTQAGCRGRGENSNVAIAQRLIHDGFIAAIRAATMEFFSGKNRPGEPRPVSPA